MTKNQETKCCSKCKKDKKLSDSYYMASSNLIHTDGKLGICKNCLEDIVDFGNIELLKNALRSIDRPFLTEAYEGSFATNPNNPFKEYMRRLGMKQNRELTWNDSDFGLQSVKVPENSTGGSLRTKWGQYSPEDYSYLEDFYKEYSHTYATDTPVQINLYKNIAKVHLQAEKELSSGNVKQFKELMELSSKLHNDGNIKPIQSTGANDDKGLSTYGLWIKNVELEEPCEYFANKPIYEDHDKFKKYLDNWFLRPLKNIFNVSKDFDVRNDDK